MHEHIDSQRISNAEKGWDLGIARAQWKERVRRGKSAYLTTRPDYMDCIIPSIIRTGGVVLRLWDFYKINIFLKFPYGHLSSRVTAEQRAALRDNVDIYVEYSP